MRRTHQSKASQQTERGMEGSSKEDRGEGRTEKGARRRHSQPAGRPNFFPLFVRRFLEIERARPFQNGQRDKAQPGRVCRPLHAVDSAQFGRLGATAPKCLFTSQKLHLHLFHRGRRGEGRGPIPPPPPPTRYARPPPSSVAAAIESLIGWLTRLTD